MVSVCEANAPDVIKSKLEWSGGLTPSNKQIRDIVVIDKRGSEEWGGRVLSLTGVYPNAYPLLFISSLTISLTRL